ncbi:MAG: histidinol-phosphate transaminase [Lachnospira sp.]|nr:histidinol-phosphate transaminase [Lachnospira sp.]
MASWKDNVRSVEPYVPGEQPKVEDVIKLNTNENPYPPAPGVLSTAALFGADNSARLRKYPDPDAGVLTEALSGFYHVPQDQIFVGVGSDDVLSMAFLTFFNSRKPILFPDITYSFYPVWAELYRIPYDTQPLDADFNIVPADYIGRDNGGIIFPNPNAPTGVYLGLDSVEEIVRANRDSVVIVDEAYIDFGGVSALPLIEKYDNLLITQTFSKSRSMAGMRIGFAFGSRDLIRAMKDVKFSFNSYTMNAAALMMGAEAVKDRKYFENCCAKIVKTREDTKKKLSALGFDFPDSKTNFIFARHRRVPASWLFDELKKRRIFVRYFPQKRIDDFLRITIGTDEQMDVLIRNLGELIDAYRV